MNANNNANNANTKITFAQISPEALAVLGGGRIAYVKPIRSEDVQKQYPEAPELAPGTLLYALHAADGVWRARLPMKPKRTADDE